MQKTNGDKTLSIIPDSDRAKCPLDESSSSHLGDKLPITSGMTIHFTYDPLGRRITKHYKETYVILGLDPGIQLDSRLRGNDINEYHHRYLYAGDN